MKTILFTLALIISASSFAEGLSPSEDLVLKLANGDSSSVITTEQAIDQDDGGRYEVMTVKKGGVTLKYTIIYNGFGEVTSAKQNSGR